MPIRRRAYPVLLALLLGCGGGDAPEPPAEPAEPAAPDVTVSRVTAGELRTLATTAGDRPRVLNFWATWCGPCVVELPEIVAFADAHPEVEVILVNLDYPSLTASHVEPFVARHGLQGRRVVQLDAADPAAAVAEAVPDWPAAIPYTVVLDRDGTRLARFDRVVDRATLERALPR